ncbi:MAG: hypothetical protein Q9168_004476 [Polycauliona sp. 1 TL-2023]
MNRPFRDFYDDSDSSDDDLRETAVKRAWDEHAGDDHHLLFGPFESPVSLYTLHPDPVQILKVWQIYTKNVNPLLRVTHIPTLQGRVIEAASNVTDVDPSLEALMFSIYCIAILSIGSEDCQVMFASSKDNLLAKYRLGCQQALWRCRFLQTTDRDCLTALLLYLISIRPSASPQSLSPMLGIAMRIAQRMRIDSESGLTDCNLFEAEIRRRLWWSLVFFDKRMSELGNSHISTLDPTWDCKIPLNVGDTDLWPEMTSLPVSRREPTEAVFAVVRSVLGDYLRQTSIHLNFSTPALIPLAKYGRLNIDQLTKLEQSIENNYLGNCDDDNPLHFMTIWTTRAQFARCHWMVHNANSLNSSTQPPEFDHDAATDSAIRLLDSDTKLMTSPLTKGFIWLNHMYFPFPGYYQIVQDLKRRPFAPHAQKAWDAVSDNWDAWFPSQVTSDSPIFKLLPKTVLQAWEVYQTSSQVSGPTLETPRIVTSIKDTLAQVAENEMIKNIEMASLSTDIDANAMTMSMPSSFADYSLLYGTETQDTQWWTPPGISSNSDPSAAIALDGYMNQMDWTMFGGQTG